MSEPSTVPGFLSCKVCLYPMSDPCAHHFIQPLTRQEALLHWSRFLPTVPAYARVRNHVVPGHENVSRLGAALRFRTVLEDEVLDETFRVHCFGDAEKWVQEVCWRRYWKGWMEMRPQVWARWRSRVRSLKHELSGSERERANRLMAGQSGVDSMDAMAKELVETGYLHNHARMWWASFWIHIEGLPWELGADFFFRNLVDADPASNTLSWRWVAGLQTVGKMYLVRRSNIEKYAPHYLVGSEVEIHRAAEPEGTPKRVMDAEDRTPVPLAAYPSFAPETHPRTGLWLHPDDLSPETGPLKTLTPVAIAACISGRVYRGLYDLSERRIESLSIVLRDALNRASVHYGSPAFALETEDPVGALCNWARDENLAEIVAFAPMVGPTADFLTRFQPRLQTMGVKLTLLRRESDTLAFNMASGGFFPFWQKMQTHLGGKIPRPSGGLLSVPRRGHSHERTDSTGSVPRGDSARG